MRHSQLLQLRTFITQALSMLVQAIFIFLTVIVSYIPLTNAASMPKWLTTPPSDSQEWFYSIGSGNTRTEAQQSAIAELASRIQVEVTTTTQQFVEGRNLGTEQKEVDYYIELDNKFQTENMNFNNLEIMREFKTATVIYVLVKIDKDSFFNAKYQQISQKLKRLQSNNPDSSSEKVSQILAYNWQKQNINNGLNLLNAYNIDTSALTSQQQQIESDNLSLARQLTVTLQLSSALPPLLRLQLEQWLTNSGLTIDKKSTAQTLQVVATSPNHWSGKDNFNFVSQIEFELAFLLNQKLIAQQSFSGQAFASEAQNAEQQAVAQLISQLKTN